MFLGMTSYDLKYSKQSQNLETFYGIIWLTKISTNIMVSGHAYST